MPHTEFSVVYTAHATHHAAPEFMEAFKLTLEIAQEAYRAGSATFVPGTGSGGMESVARQLAPGKRCLVVRNGLFSFRWSAILDAAQIAREVRVLKARQVEDAPTAPFAPPPVDEVVAAITEQRSEVVFVPQVETSAGMLLPDDYLTRVAEATHAVGGLLVVDAIAAGPLFVDMPTVGADVVISAPQKTWSGTPCGAMVMMTDAVKAGLKPTSSFALDLAHWTRIADSGRAMKVDYHATLPTDTIIANSRMLAAVRDLGFDTARARQWELGTRVRAGLADLGYPSVAAPDFESPSVVVVYADDALATGDTGGTGVRVSNGVPLQLGERPDYRAVRIGLFGLSKLTDVDGTARDLLDAFAALRRA